LVMVTPSAMVSVKGGAAPGSAADSPASAAGAKEGVALQGAHR
jgi:hypothetical protein